MKVYSGMGKHSFWHGMLSSMYVNQMTVRLGTFGYQNRPFQVKHIINLTINCKNIISLQVSCNDRTTQIHILISHSVHNFYFLTILHFVEKSKRNLWPLVGLTKSLHCSYN